MNIIHPGWITSKTDGDRHYITFGQLVRLYDLDPRTCIHASDLHRRPSTDDNHYYPRQDGNYDRDISVT